MPMTQVNTPDGKVVDVDHPDGALERDILAYAAQQYSIDPSIAYEPTTALGALGEAGKRLIGGVATGTARVGTGLAELIPGVDDEAAQAVQRGVDEFVADKLAYDPAYDENYGAQLGEVVGEMAPMVGSLFLPGGAVTSATRLATMIGPAVSEGGMDRAEYEERTGEALSTAERLTAKGADVGLGMLERLGIPTRILKGLPRGFFDKPEANSILRRMESMIASGLQEGVQEVGQGIARDITTLAIYDPDRKIADSVMDDFALGGGAGAVLDLAIGLAQTPLKGRRGGAPKPIEEMTEEEIAEEQSRRDRFDQSERERREGMDRGLIVSGEAPAIAGEIGPQLPEAREDPLDPTLIDPALPVEQMAGQVVTRLGSRLPVAKTFSVGSMDNKFYAEIDGEQFGPALEDPTVAQELSNRLTEASRQLGRNAEVEYVVENSGIEYTGQQAAEVRQLGRAIPSPQERIIRAEDANEAVGRDIASVINRQKADRGEAEAEVFTLEEVRAANRGDVGRLGDVLAVKDADFLAFRDDQPTPQAPLSPTQPRQPALGRRQQALSTLSSSFENMISSERAFTDLFASKRMDLTVNSEPFRGLVKRIIGKTPSKQNPLDNLSSNERRYLYHRVRKLPSFQEQVTQIPDFSTKTPDGELVRIARRQIEVDQPPRMAVEAAAFGQTGQIPSQAEVRRVEEEARRTARPIERAGEVVPAGQEIVPYDLDQSALGQQLRDALRRFGIDDQYATRMVERVGNARRDSDGNIYILPIKKRDDGTIVAGSAQAGAKVIQVGLDAVMQDVNKGASYEDAVAKIMNHEILHALRAMDLFTAEEYSLLERLSRKYQKPGTGKTYGQWAVDMYGDVSAVKLQEEAIAEMISDGLTTGVVMDGDVKKPAGKPRTIFNKIVDFFKSLVGVAKDNDIDSFKTLVDSIQSGAVGRRERGQIRTPLRTEISKGEIADRGITAEDVGLETGKRGRSLTPRQVINQVRQELEDAPDVDTAMLSRTPYIPAPENAQKTQRANTIGTYRKAGAILNKIAGEGRGLDFSSGLGIGAGELGFESYEPFPKDGVNPTYLSAAQIPVGAFDKITNLNTLNVVPRKDRDTIVRSIAAALAPDGVAAITARGKEVMKAQGSPGPEPTSIITSGDTYQKGFTTSELVRYLQETLGSGFEVSSLNLGPAGALVKRLDPSIDEQMFSRRQIGAEDVVQTSLPIRVINKERVFGIGAPADNVIGTERILSDPKLTKKIATAIRGYNFLDTKGMSDIEAIQALRDHAKSNLAWLHGQMDPAVRDIAKRWYDGARKQVDAWASKYQIEPRQAAAVVANLSPQKDWFMNMSLAERVLDTLAFQGDFRSSDKMRTEFERVVMKGGKIPPTKESALAKTIWDKIKDAKLSEVRSLVGPKQANLAEAIWVRMFDEAHNPRSYRVIAPTGQILDFATNEDGSQSKIAWGSFTEIAKAVGAARSSDLEAISRGLGNAHKVRNFYNNIVSPASALGEVTIDTHAVAAALFKPLSGKGYEVFHAFGTTPAVGVLGMPKGVKRAGAGSSGPLGVSGTYGIFADAYRDAARELGILPRELQSITWEEIRAIFPASFKDGKGNLGKINTLWDDYAKGSLDLDTVREQAYDIAGTRGNKPVWFGRSRTGRTRGKSNTTYDRFVSKTGISRQEATGVKSGRGSDVDDPAFSRRTVATPQQLDAAVDKNIASIAENPTGVPRFSVKASPEAQYIAQNPERALDADEPMYAVRGDIPAVDRLTKGPDREESNGKVFMEATNTGPLGAALTRLKAGAIFRYAGLEKYYQKVPGLRELEADSSAIAAALFADKSKAILASAVKYGVPVYQDGLTKVVAFTHKGDTYRGLIGVMSLIYNKDVGDLRKLAQAYAMVQRGDYLKGKNKLTPVDAKSRQEVLDAVEALTDADGYNPVTTWHEVWSAYNNRTIDFLKATGILNDQTADIWRGSSYIPFYRTGVSEDALPKVASNVFGDLTRMSEFRAYQGSDKAVDVGLIESVVLNLSTAIDMGMKNVAQQRITRDMQNMGLARQVKSGGAIPKGMNAIDFKVNGKKTRFEIDDNLIYDSMTSLTSGTVEQLATKYLGMPSNFLRELVTRDPGFMMANMLRDTLSTWTTSGASFVPVFDTFKGLGDGVERLEKLGVLGGYDFSLDKQDIVKFYKAENERRTESMNPLNMFTRIWDWAGKATTLSDAATRNAVYNDVLARTGNEAEAAFQAMEIINFARRGSHPLARVLVAAIPFLNARFQGLDVFVRAAAGNYSTRKDQPASIGQLKLAYRGGILAGLTTLYYLLVSDEDWYNEQDDYVREMNWLAPTESGVPIKFPIPFEVGLLYKTIPEAILASTIGNQSDRELRQTLQRGLVSTLEVNPLGVQAIAPLVEASLNHNFLTGRPVVPYYVDKITTGLQGNANTTQMATDIGKVLPISPLKIDHVARGYTGTIGSYLILTADSLYRTATGAEDKRPAKNIFEFPLWKRFFASKEGTGLRSDAYDLSNDITEVTNTINSLRKAGRIDELEAYIASRQNLLDIKQPVTVLKGRLDRARQQKEKIKSSDMDENTKRQMLDDIDADLNQYLKVVPRLKELADAPFIQTTF